MVSSVSLFVIELFLADKPAQLMAFARSFDWVADDLFQQENWALWKDNKGRQRTVSSAQQIMRSTPILAFTYRSRLRTKTPVCHLFMQPGWHSSGSRLIAHRIKLYPIETVVFVASFLLLINAKETL